MQNKFHFIFSFVLIIFIYFGCQKSVDDKISAPSQASEVVHQSVLVVTYIIDQIKQNYQYSYLTETSTDSYLYEMNNSYNVFGQSEGQSSITGTLYNDPDNIYQGNLQIDMKGFSNNSDYIISGKTSSLAIFNYPAQSLYLKLSSDQSLQGRYNCTVLFDKIEYTQVINRKMITLWGKFLTEEFEYYFTGNSYQIE